MNETIRYPCPGACHCGRVRVLVQVLEKVTVRRCNCSICAKSGYLHLIVDRQHFELLAGAVELREYRFNTGVARHLFCGHCGIKPFYIPRSHPDGYSVNLNCLELDSRVRVSVEDFDGQHWRKNVARITQVE
jgi:hypothetical protein